MVPMAGSKLAVELNIPATISIIMALVVEYWPIALPVNVITTLILPYLSFCFFYLAVATTHPHIYAGPKLMNSLKNIVKKSPKLSISYLLG